MNTISELLDELRKYAAEYNLPPFGREIDGTVELLEQAADAIESLSVKLPVANMERPVEGGGWIPCKERLPDVKVSESVKTGICKDNGEHFLVTDTEGYVYESVFWANKQEFEDEVIAWMPKPEPYRRKDEV